MSHQGFRVSLPRCRTVLFLLRQNSALLLAGFALESGFISWFYITENATWHLLSPVFFMIFCSYLLITFFVKKGRQGEGALQLIVIFAIVFRLTLLFSQPVLSTDIYRYYWEGKVIANGFNPYLYSPDAPELAPIRDSIWTILNLKYVSASYPPLLELFFAFVYVVFRSVFGYKIVFLILDLALIAVICLLLRELNLHKTNVIVYAWAPLPIIEVAQTGHNDPLVMLLIFAAFLLLLRERNAISAHIMALSVVSKFFSAFFAPMFFKRWGKRCIVVFFATIVVFYAPLANMGLGLFNGLLFAINTVYFNGSIFPAIVNILDRLGTFENVGFAAQLVVYAVYAVILLWAYLFSYDEADRTGFMRLSFVLTGSFLLLNRAFFPWYSIWIVPFLAFFNSVSWLLLSGTIFLGYMKYDSFPPPSFEAVDPQTRLLIDLAQYLPFYVLLVYEILRGKTGRKYRYSPAIARKPVHRFRMSSRLLMLESSIAMYRGRK